MGVGPAVPPGVLGELDGELLALGLGHAARGEVGRQVVAPPGVRPGRCRLLVLGGHRLVVRLFQGGQVGIQAGLAQRREEVGGFGEDQHPAGVEQDRADLRCLEGAAADC